jgi:hypothetical protein
MVTTCFHGAHQADEGPVNAEFQVDMQEEPREGSQEEPQEEI